MDICCPRFVILSARPFPGLALLFYRFFLILIEARKRVSGRLQLPLTEKALPRTLRILL